MEARPALSIQRSGAKQLGNIGMSGPLSSSLPVLPAPLKETFPKLPDSQQVSIERELVTRPLNHARHLPSSNSGVVGHMFSSSPGLSSHLHYSSLSPCEKHSRSSPFISQSLTNGASLPLTHNSHSGSLRSTASSHYAKDNTDFWHTDSLASFLDFPVNASIENGQAESSSCNVAIASEEFCKWADQLITDNDALTSNWTELLGDTCVMDLEPKVGSS